MTISSDDLESITDHTTSTVRVLPFDLVDRSYCVEIERVASVLGVGDETALEGADDPWNAGTISIAGERVRVIDLPRVVTAAARTLARVPEPKLLVFDAGESGYVGWLVDAVGTATSVRPAAVASPQTAARFLKGRLDLDGRELLWLDERAINE